MARNKLIEGNIAVKNLLATGTKATKKDLDEKSYFDPEQNVFNVNDVVDFTGCSVDDLVEVCKKENTNGNTWYSLIVPVAGGAKRLSLGSLRARRPEYRMNGDKPERTGNYFECSSYQQMLPAKTAMQQIELLAGKKLTYTGETTFTGAKFEGRDVVGTQDTKLRNFTIE